jgi:hypothetical protein
MLLDRPYRLETQGFSVDSLLDRVAITLYRGLITVTRKLEMQSEFHRNQASFHSAAILLRATGNSDPRVSLKHRREPFD